MKWMLKVKGADGTFDEMYYTGKVLGAGTTLCVYENGMLRYEISEEKQKFIESHPEIRRLFYRHRLQ
jgi:hypothetical protein